MKRFLTTFILAVSIIWTDAATTIVAAAAQDVNNILLDCKAVPGANVYDNVADAIKAINSIASRSNRPVTLTVAPGVYWLDDPDDPEIRVNPDKAGDIPYGQTIVCDTLIIRGLDDNPCNTVFASNRGQTQGAVGNFTMIHFIGRSFEIHNMTLGNYCNVDLEYPLDPSQNRPRRGDAIVQAQVGICTGTDRMFASNCRFISRLNLCPMIGAHRSLYKNCHFESTDDALTGSGVYLQCHFTFHSGKPFFNTPLTGAVMLDCDIDVLTKGIQYFTKSPGAMSLVDTRLHSKGPGVPAKVAWTPYPSSCISYVSNVTLDGKPLVIDAERPELTVDLTGKEALAAYRLTTSTGDTIYNIPSLVGGDDNWDPLNQSDEILSLFGNQELLRLPVTLAIESGDVKLKAAGDTLRLATEALRWGGYRSDVFMSGMKWDYPNVFKPVGVDGLTATFISQNENPQPVDRLLFADTKAGLKGAIRIDVAANLAPAPAFLKEPVLKSCKKNRCVEVEYTLDNDEPSIEDRSHIVWYRYSKNDMSDTIPICHGPAATTRVYQLTGGDRGYRVTAKVTPAAYGTEGGTPVMTAGAEVKNVKKKRRGEDVTITTDFSDVAVYNQPHIMPGAWMFDCYKPIDTAGYEWDVDNSRPAWYYGRGTDGATGVGLVQAVRGARAFYMPVDAGECRQEQVKVVLQPCKTAGQGFGSATGQYLDIYVGLTPGDKLNGYGLRIERTANHDKAVEFSLIKISDNKVVKLTEPVASSCYRSDCTVTLTLTGDELTATAVTDAPAPENLRRGVMESVDLRVGINREEDHGNLSESNMIGFQHTGTTGAGATLIKSLDAVWKEQ